MIPMIQKNLFLTSDFTSPESLGLRIGKGYLLNDCS
jgi:hypothetical protein